MSAYDMTPLLDRMNALADDKYRAFNESLTPGIAHVSIGVRVPALRAMRKDILKGDWRGFLAASRSHALHEARMLHAMVLGSAKCPIEEKIDLIDAFLPCVDNWAVCDVLCADLKPRPADREALYPFVRDCAASDETFRKRFGLIMLMDYYRDDPRALESYRAFRHEAYYARMGCAWGLATLFLFQREGVLSILESGVLDDFTQNKAIQKMRESYRITAKDKQMLLNYKRKRQNP